MEEIVSSKTKMHALQYIQLVARRYLFEKAEKQIGITYRNLVKENREFTGKDYFTYNGITYSMSNRYVYKRPSKPSSIETLHPSLHIKRLEIEKEQKNIDRKISYVEGLIYLVLNFDLYSTYDMYSPLALYIPEIPWNKSAIYKGYTPKIEVDPSTIEEFRTKHKVAYDIIKKQKALNLLL